MTWQVLEADCVEQMKLMDEASVDAVVTDPPYSLRFMSRAWDDQGEGAQIEESHRAWATEALRVLKPGGHLLAFGGTRTSHRLACAVEDAGFEIRDSVIWLYGSGFPKSLAVDKAIDRAGGGGGFAAREELRALIDASDLSDAVIAERAGVSSALVRFWRRGERTIQFAEFERIRDLIGGDIPEPAIRDVMGSNPNHRDTSHRTNDQPMGQAIGGELITAPATPEAQRWQGWGTALKPAHEPIVVARKPLIGTVAQNVERFGTGALAIDRCRIGTSDNLDGGAYSGDQRQRDEYSSTDSAPGAEPLSRLNRGIGEYEQPSGRWPANVCLSHLAECQRVGERRVKNPGGVPRADSDKDSTPAFTSSERTSTVHHFADDGLETVEAWSCAEGCPVRELDRQSGEAGGAPGFRNNAARDEGDVFFGQTDRIDRVTSGYGDSGGASRFFYVAKASRAERNLGLGTEDGVGQNAHPT